MESDGLFWARRRPLDVVFNDVSTSIGNKTILQRISGECRSGEIMFVMGPSGSGKSTLLNVLGGRLQASGGVVQIGREPLSRQMQRQIGYVQQQDIFFTDLTLRQTLTFTAMLHLPEHMSYQDKTTRVDYVIDLLDIRHCQHTIIGNMMKPGLSGGEKKRTNIAAELLTNPSVILLDEPTSGLDSSTALSVMNMLKSLAEKENKTVIVSVHQPSSKIFHMANNLLLLCNGQIAFFGETSKVVDHFASVGLPINPQDNPADAMLEYVRGSSDIQSRLIQAALMSPQTLNHYESSNSINTPTNRQTVVREEDTSGYPSFSKDTTSTKSVTDNTDDFTQKRKWKTSFFTQLKVLTKRNFLVSRSFFFYPLNWFQTVFLSFLAGFIWFQVKRTEIELVDIQGWMFFSTTYWMFYIVFAALQSFPSAREVIMKERASGSYRISAYYIAMMIGELPLTVTMPSIYVLISYPMMMGTNIKIWMLFTHLIMLLLNTIVAQSVGLLIGAVCMDFQVGITVSSIYVLYSQLLGGFLVRNFPPWLSWAKYLSIVHYAFQNMNIIEFQYGSQVRCLETSSRFSGCNNGTEFIPIPEILNERGDSNPVWLNTTILLSCLLIMRILTYLVLRFGHRQGMKS